MASTEGPYTLQPRTDAHPCDQRATPGGPVRVGDRVELYATENTPDDVAAWGVLTVVVESVEPGLAGRLVEPVPPHIPGIAAGDAVIFSQEHVIEIRDP